MMPLRLPRFSVRIPTPWRGHRPSPSSFHTWKSQRVLAYKRIDDSGYGYFTVFVAGVGFLTDAYDIFAVNTVLPMLEISYWNGHIPTSQQLAINQATLIGTLLGQVTFGVLADRYGRKHVYGYELLIVIGATVMMALSSKGALNSVNILAWVIVWRLLMGIGIGADYPLSAAIASEFAPTKYRARMLATVFFMQPIGQLLGNIVSIVTISTRRDDISNADPNNCDGACLHAVDIIWRWVVGFGAILPLFAICFRFWMPESTRYMFDVERDTKLGSDAAQVYFPAESESAMLQQQGVNGALDVVPSVEDYPLEMEDMDLMAPDATEELQMAQPMTRVTWEEYRKGLYKYLFDEGMLRPLLGTSFAWCLLDFCFYFLGVNSPSIISKLWGAPEYGIVYHMLMDYSWRTLITTSAPGLIGGAIFIRMARFRWKIQLYGFLILGVMFVVVGICFITLIGGRYFAVIIVLYAICSLFFDFGPNTSTFIIPAEVFQTRYRCTCHGISAASGKLGSILAQVVLAKAKGLRDTRSNKLGIALITFIIPMVLGAIVTKLMVPNPCDRNGKSKPLEQLGLPARKKVAQ